MENKELKRELADLRYILHQTQTMLANEKLDRKRSTIIFKREAPAAAALRSIENEPQEVKKDAAREFKAKETKLDLEDALKL